MKLKYFKNYENSHDCYVGENLYRRHAFDFYKIVSISKDHFFLFANDESSNYPDGKFDGFYRLMEVKENDFESLKDAARKKDRKKGLDLIRKIHEENPDRKPNIASVEGILENFDSEKTFEFYQKANPILE
ncbi:hypothetical protein COU58_00045 [Candidatus Pacearchaeota archaeon CG10_big_fil_rev_8_21_14_0_10_32_42]|nr:MAG: hypothetical protein COU58_00045 [Candidatus Pacearchaeota archaeon CG10_big_fil_rev_8_21_14_0_10_32_42]